MPQIVSTAQADVLKAYLGEELFSRLHSSRHLFLPIGAHGCFLSFYFCDLAAPALPEERISIYCDAKTLLCVSDSARCAALFSALPEGAPFAQLLQFFLILTAGDVDLLDQLEDDITELEDNLLTASHPVRGASADIITLRRTLLRLKRYYEQLALMTSGLVENENGALSGPLQKRFAVLDRRIDHLLDSVLHLREYITQVREAYQAQIDIEQNQIMKLFTVLTAIFLPLTLIVGWYGMNFSIPEYGWHFGYLYVIFLSIAVCGGTFLFFWRKKWF